MRDEPSGALISGVVVAVAALCTAVVGTSEGSANATVWLAVAAASVLFAWSAFGALVLPHINATHTSWLVLWSCAAGSLLAASGGALLCAAVLCSLNDVSASVLPFALLVTTTGLEFTATMAASCLWTLLYCLFVAVPLLPAEAVAHTTAATVLWPALSVFLAVWVSRTADSHARDKWTTEELAVQHASDAARAIANNGSTFGDTWRGGSSFNVTTPSGVLAKTPLQQAISQLQQLQRHSRSDAERAALDDVLRLLMHNPDLLVIDYETALGHIGSRAVDERTAAWVTSELQARRLHSNPRISPGKTLRERRTSARRVLSARALEAPPLVASPHRRAAGDGEATSTHSSPVGGGGAATSSDDRSSVRGKGSAPSVFGSQAGTVGSGMGSGGARASSAHGSLGSRDISIVGTSMDDWESRRTAQDTPTPRRRMEMVFPSEASSRGDGSSEALSSVHATSPRVSAILDNVAEWEFDVFELAAVTSFKPLVPLASCVFQDRLGLCEACSVPFPVLRGYLKAVEAGYCYDPNKQNPYHTSVHAADVTQATAHFLMNPKVEAIVETEDAFAILLAAVVHDFRHPGVSSNFLIATGDELSVRYNDQSVLENFHAAEAFALMRKPGLDVLARMEPEAKKDVRLTVIQCVLATDLAQGQRYYAAFTTRANAHDFGEDDGDGLLLLQMVLKCADVAHPARPLELHKRWSDLISQEFFEQGDRERALGIPISPLCDRENADMSKSQQGFIEFVVRPCFDPFSKFCETETWRNNIQLNRRYWMLEAKREAEEAAVRVEPRKVSEATVEEDSEDGSAGP